MSVQPILNTFGVILSLLAINFQMPSYEASGDHLNIYTDLFLRDITLNELQSHRSSYPVPSELYEIKVKHPDFKMNLNIVRTCCVSQGQVRLF